MALTRPQTARAWVNFNGTGTVAIRDSFNVTSITDNGTGDYTVNFDQAMPSADYSVGHSILGISGGNLAFALHLVSTSTTSLNVITMQSTVGNTDRSIVCVQVFGDAS